MTTDGRVILTECWTADSRLLMKWTQMELKTEGRGGGENPWGK